LLFCIDCPGRSSSVSFSPCRSTSSKGTHRRPPVNNRSTVSGIVSSRGTRLKSKYYIPKVHSAYLEQFEEGLAVSYDPLPNGYCQFAAVAQQLHLFGIHRSAYTQRAEVVNFMQSNIHGELLRHFQSFVPGGWSDYVRNMQLNGTHGDHITLDVMSRLYNVQF